MKTIFIMKMIRKALVGKTFVRYFLTGHDSGTVQDGLTNRKIKAVGLELSSVNTPTFSLTLEGLNIPVKIYDDEEIVIKE